MKTLTIASSVRPGRVAVLIDITDTNWRNICKHILEYFAQMWGGYGNIIIPTDGAEIEPIFWRLLEAFDPDYLYVYRRSGRDLELDDPIQFEKSVESHLQPSDFANEGMKESIRKGLRSVVLSQFNVSEGLQQQIKYRLAPFYFQQWIVRAGALSAGSKPAHPHTKITDILPQTEHPADFLIMNYEAHTADSLWFESAVGIQNAETQNNLRSLGLTAEGMSVEPDSAPFSTIVESTGPSTAFSKAPANLSLLSLGLYSDTRRRDWQEPVLAVCGNTVRDFCLFFTLSRIRDRVLWILPSLTDQALSDGPHGFDYKSNFAHCLFSASSYSNVHEPGIKFTSATLAESQVETVRAYLQTCVGTKFPDGAILSPEHITVPYPTRLYEANNAFVPRAIHVPDDGTIPLFATPKPKNFRHIDPSNHRWITELAFLKYHLPPHPALGQWLLGSSITTTEDIRVSAVGPSYFCPNQFIMRGRDIDTTLMKPSIRVPTVSETFRVIAADGQLACAISDKGFYAQECIQKFGGLEPMANFFRSAAGRALIAATLDKSPPQQGKHDVGVFLNDRRYMDFAAIRNAVGSEETAATITDSFAEKGIFYRGFIFQCRFCKDSDWFAAGEVTDRFTCRRCHKEQVFTRANWKHPEQPRWYHQLDEIVYQAFVNDMHVPVLALSHLQRSSRDSFLFCPELKYTKAGETAPFVESDLNFIADGTLSIGEAKKTNALGETTKAELSALERYRDLATSIHPKQIVFATAADDWNSGTKQNIHQVLGPLGLEIMLLAKKELYT